MLLPILLLIAQTPPTLSDTVPAVKKELAAAVVSAYKPLIIQKTDRLILNVSGSPLAAGGTAYDAVLRAPGLTDRGGLSFRGKAVLVLIDGKQTNLQGDDLKTYLEAMPAGTIDKIEILSHPPARY